MNQKLTLIAFIVSLSGFLFGFDSVVISGVNLPLKQLWNTSPWFHGTFIISISLWGTALGSLIGGYPTELLGRKRTLVWIGVLFLVSAIGTAFPNDPLIFSLFRFIGGFAAGVAAIVAPVYISEISTAENRGRLGMLFQLNLVIGIFAAFVSNYLLQGFSGPDDWRYMLGIEAIPAILFTCLLFLVPESPRWLVLNQNKEEEGKLILSRFISSEKIEELLLRWKSNTPEANDTVRLFSKKYHFVLLLSFLIAFFNQFSGISFILFYVPEILVGAGLPTSDSLLGSAVVGLVNILFTFVGIYLIDKAGRKTLMYIGSVGYIISLSGVAIGLYFRLPAELNVVFLLLFISSHAVGQGAVIWVFISEIFPTEVRSYGQAWGAGILNLFAALIALFGSVLIHLLAGWMVFALFAGFMVLQLLFTHFIMPETRGISLEEIERRLVGEK